MAASMKSCVMPAIKFSAKLTKSHWTTCLKIICGDSQWSRVFHGSSHGSWTLFTFLTTLDESPVAKTQPVFKDHKPSFYWQILVSSTRMLQDVMWGETHLLHTKNKALIRPSKKKLVSVGVKERNPNSSVVLRHVQQVLDLQIFSLIIIWSFKTEMFNLSSVKLVIRDHICLIQHGLIVSFVSLNAPYATALPLFLLSVGGLAVQALCTSVCICVRLLATSTLQPGLLWAPWVLLVTRPGSGSDECLMVCNGRGQPRFWLSFDFSESLIPVLIFFILF